MMTRAQEVAIATAVQQLRPDWDHPGIVAALRAAQAHGTPAEIAAAACRLAGDTNTRTPGRLKDPGAHWKACLLYTSPSPRDRTRSRMPSSA